MKVLCICGRECEDQDTFSDDTDSTNERLIVWNYLQEPQKKTRSEILWMNQSNPDDNENNRET